MKRRSLLLLGFLSPIALYTSRFLGARAVKAQAPIDGRKQAEELNQLASTIETPADARRFVDFLADIFSRDAPSGWTRNSLRNLIAQAEFAAVSDPQKTIPKARLAEAWNRYVDTLQAPGDQKVTAEELHNLRDAIWTSARLAWKGNRGNFWAVPSIYATLPDGDLAPGCRAVESIRLLWDLANMPDNLKGARDRVSKGQLSSDIFRKELQSPQLTLTGARMSFSEGKVNPVWLAQRNYAQAKGKKAFNQAVVAMLTKTLS